jgi:hypothetical protein
LGGKDREGKAIEEKVKRQKPYLNSFCALSRSGINNTLQNLPVDALLICKFPIFSMFLVIFCGITDMSYGYTQHTLHLSVALKYKEKIDDQNAVL